MLCSQDFRQNKSTWFLNYKSIRLYSEFLKTKCNSDMCNNDKDSIFLSKQGHFRKPLKITLKCSTNKGLCSQFAKSTSSKVEDSNNGRLTCKKNTFENFDSMKSLRCSWNNTTLEQVQCMENILLYHLYVIKIVKAWIYFCSSGLKLAII